VDPRKVDARSLISLLQVVLAEAGTRCGTSTIRDLKTISERVEHEGISFLMISLPSFCRDFEKSLDRGQVDHAAFVGFRRHRGLPRFLGGFLDRVFDRGTGSLLSDPCIESIRCVRQITLMWAKIEVPCTPAREKAAFDAYAQAEQDVRLSDLSVKSSKANRLDDFSRIGRLLWADYLSSVDSRVYNDSVMPKHGPGATADKLRGNAKYNNLQWTRRLEVVFPHWEHLIPSPRFLGSVDRVSILEPRDEIPVRVISVPKTLKTPRIIAVEPTCMQYMQQGILSVMVQQVPSSDNARNFICAESQEPNQVLAREGSLTGGLATLDLSEASDRVSNQHVRLLLQNHRALREAVDATRSRKADVPGHGVLRLAKFASMGSALTFQMEMMVFTTIVFVGIERALGRSLRKSDIQSFFGKVRVYGDDIVVPTDYVQPVIEELEAFGLRVNHDKSFWTGKFRESCGSDWYDGRNVSVARLRRGIPNNKQHVPELVSLISFRNQMFNLGWYEVSRFLDEWIIGRLRVPFPTVLETSTLLGRHDFYLPSQETRHDPHLHHPLVRGMKVSSVSPVSLLDDYGALMKWFLKQGREPFVDRKHLERAGRASIVRIKTGWARPW